MDDQEKRDCCQGFNITVNPEEKGFAIHIKCEDPKQADAMKKRVMICCCGSEKEEQSSSESGSSCCGK